MTMTMTLGKRPIHRDTPRGGEELGIPEPRTHILDAIRRSLFATISNGFGYGVEPPLISPAFDREIRAIDNFAHFLSTHPDMPTEHRARFLRQILRSCEEIRKEVS